MIDICAWTDTFLNALSETFGERVWFAGLQGSYARGEAAHTSDIDMVVILDELSASDIQAYNAMLDTLPHRELVCGFLSGKREILKWDAADLFQFYHDTTPLRGRLDELIPLIDEAAVRRAIKTGACNIYHGCVHNMLYEKSVEILKDLYKAACFVVQAICFTETGKYIRSRKNLQEMVSPDERMIVETCTKLKNGEKPDFDSMSEMLFNWSRGWIGR